MVAKKAKSKAAAFDPFMLRANLKGGKVGKSAGKGKAAKNAKPAKADGKKKKAKKAKKFTGNFAAV